LLPSGRNTRESVFKSAYLKETLKTMPMKFTRPSALLAYKTEAYMKENYTLRLNVMTGTAEYRQNALGYGFQPLDQAARNTMAIKALKAGVDSWDKDLARYIDSNLIPRYYPMEDFIRHLPKWNGKHDYVGEMARRVKTDNPYWEEDFHRWMLSMVAQWLGKNRHVYGDGSDDPISKGNGITQNRPHDPVGGPQGLLEEPRQYRRRSVCHRVSTDSPKLSQKILPYHPNAGVFSYLCHRKLLNTNQNDEKISDSIIDGCAHPDGDGGTAKTCGTVPCAYLDRHWRHRP